MVEQGPKTRLQAERTKRQWTQAEVSEKIDVEVNTFGRWERGEQIAAPLKRRELSELFGEKVDISWFQRLDMTEERPRQLWNVPYRSNPYFTDNENRVQRLHELLIGGEEAGASHVSISGLGGVGKTQLALAYVYTYRDSYKTILWARAGNQEQLIKDIADIAYLLQVPETKKPEPRQHYLINEVFYWLETHSEWLFILDNVEEDINKTGNLEVELQIGRWLSLLQDGHFLFTTRAQSIANMVQNFLLDALEEEEGAQLLLYRSHLLSLPVTQQVQESLLYKKSLALAKLLGKLPLALEQAAAYIQETGCSLTDYQQLYETSRKEILQLAVKYKRLYTDYDETVATTWLISFQRVEQQSTIASEMLKLYAHLAPDSIPEDLILKGAYRLDSNLQKLAGDLYQFNAACQVLLNYSLIKRSAEKSLSIHRLVQAVLQDDMDEATRRFWAKQAVQVVEYTFSDALSTQQNVEPYIPHASICATFIKKLELEGQEVARLLEMAASTVYKHGWYAQARPLYLRAHAAAMDLLGSKDIHTLSLWLDVARVHMDLGAYPFAAAIYQSVKDDYEELFGQDSPQIVACLNGLALAQLKIGDLLDAEQTYGQIIAWYKQVKTPDAALQATSYHIAAQVSLNLFSNYRAEAYFKAALNRQVHVFGIDHPNVARGIADLGSFYSHYLRDFEQAEPFLRKALEIRRRLLGDDHPDTAESLIYLAVFDWKKKNYEEAEQYYQEALTIRRQKLGQYHPDVVSTLHDLAVMLAELGRDKEAEQYFREMLTIAPLAGGTESYEYAILLDAYADFLKSRGRTTEAEDYNRRIVDLVRRLKIRGPLHFLNFSSGNEGEQAAASTSMWFFKRQG
jgi:tetratricopeptide (TPR) repeat protein